MITDRKVYDNRYRLKHPEKGKESYDRWELAHPEQRRKLHREWNNKHPELMNSIKEKFLLLHPNYEEEYRKTSKGKEVKRKSQAKRRKLGFIPLNKPFEGSSPHHIDIERVIHMPRKLHQSIPHSVIHNRNMERINSEAYKFLTKEG